MVIYLQVDSTLWKNIHASFIIEVIIELVEAYGMKTGIYVNHWMDKLPAHRQTWELNNNDRHLASKSVALGSKNTCMSTTTAWCEPNVDTIWDVSVETKEHLASKP